MPILHIVSVRFLEHHLTAFRWWPKKLEHVLLRQPETQSAEALRPQHRFRGGLIRTTIGRIEHVEHECADEDREYSHGVTQAHVRRRPIPKSSSTFSVYDFCQRASFGILHVKIPVRKPGIPNSTIFSRTRACISVTEISGRTNCPF